MSLGRGRGGTVGVGAGIGEKRAREQTRHRGKGHKKGVRNLAKGSGGICRTQSWRAGRAAECVTRALLWELDPRTAGRGPNLTLDLLLETPTEREADFQRGRKY